MKIFNFFLFISPPPCSAVSMWRTGELLLRRREAPKPVVPFLTFAVGFGCGFLGCFFFNKALSKLRSPTCGGQSDRRFHIRGFSVPPEGLTGSRRGAELGGAAASPGGGNPITGRLRVGFVGFFWY